MTDSDGDWGSVIEKTINFGREDCSTKYKKICPNSDQYDSFTHCSHVMIYARTDSTFDDFEKKAIILMQMRFDGYIGFPGGIVEPDETPLQALWRELAEELGWTDDDAPVTENDYMFTHVNEDKQLVLHFYAAEVTECKLQQIECNMVNAPDYGCEVLGNFRVPLYIMGDAFRGFPSFLRNHFVGNAKLQLIEACINLKFFTEEQMVQALYSGPLITF